MRIDDAQALRVQTLTKVIGWTILTLGLLTVFITAYFAIRVYSPVWFADDWQVPMDYIALGGHYPISKLWAQHNEHRVPFVKSLLLFSLFYLQGNHAFLIAMNYLFQVLEWLAVIYFVMTLFGLTQIEFLTAAGLSAFFIVNPNQLQNVEWAFSSWFTTYFLAVVALGGLSTYSIKRRPFWLILAVIAAALAEVNLASGVLVWLILPLCAILLGLSWRLTGLLGAIGAAAIGIYLIGYHSPSNASSPLDAIRHPDQVIGFVLAYFGESWSYIWPKAGNAFALAAVLLVVMIALYQFTWRALRPAGEAFALSVALLCLMSGFITGLGRQMNGVVQAREARYQTCAMLFWCALGLYAILTIKKLAGRQVYVLAAVQCFFCVVMVGEAASLPAIYRMNLSAGYIRDTVGAALETSVDALDRIQMVYPGPESVPPTYNYLHYHKLMAPPLGMQHLMGVKLNSRYTLATADKCVGETDNITVVGTKNGRKELFVQGWAYQSGVQPLNRLVAVTEEGLIAGLGVSGAERPDILPLFPQVTGLNCGWNLYALVPETTKKLNVYGLIPGTNSVCTVAPPKPVPEYTVLLTTPTITFRQTRGSPVPVP